MSKTWDINRIYHPCTSCTTHNGWLMPSIVGGLIEKDVRTSDQWCTKVGGLFHNYRTTISWLSYDCQCYSYYLFYQTWIARWQMVKSPKVSPVAVHCPVAEGWAECSKTSMKKNLLRKMPRRSPQKSLQRSSPRLSQQSSKTQPAWHPTGAHRDCRRCLAKRLAVLGRTAQNVPDGPSFFAQDPEHSPRRGIREVLHAPLCTSASFGKTLVSADTKSCRTCLVQPKDSVQMISRRVVYFSGFLAYHQIIKAFFAACYGIDGPCIDDSHIQMVIIHTYRSWINI